MDRTDERRYSDYFAKLVDNEIVSKNGTPLKCPLCGTSILKPENKILSKETKMLVSFETKCVPCNCRIAKWNNGVWTLIYFENIYVGHYLRRQMNG